MIDRPVGRVPSVVSPLTVPPTFLEGLQSPTTKPCKLQGFVRLARHLSTDKACKTMSITWFWRVSPPPIDRQTLQNLVNYSVLWGYGQTLQGHVIYMVLQGLPVDW